ncbi:MAG: hypothetical protein QM762_02230 [Chryseolinea sp.]
MTESQDIVFRQLFTQACQKCFGHTPVASLTETDARTLSNDILQQTGLLLGIKSLKNYSIYFFDSSQKKENPSIATLDTLARYVLGAPSTNEITRKDTEPHHPYWFRYKTELVLPIVNKPVTADSDNPDETAKLSRPNRFLHYVLYATLLAVAIAAIVITLHRTNQPANSQFRDDFNDVSDESLRATGWSVQQADNQYWPMHDSRTGYITLHTLIGDNWPGSDTVLPVRNLLTRPIEEECFAVEVQFKELRLTHNWQQAGIILAEDPDFRTRVIRLSLSYNDFFGGYTKEPEIIIQGLSSVESSQFSKPEEFAHIPLLTLTSGTESLVWNNLRNAALKIEKKGNIFRFLFSTGATEVFAFKEAVHREYQFNPKYVALFATQGLARESHIAPIFVDQFSIIQISCD